MFDNCSFSKQTASSDLFSHDLSSEVLDQPSLQAMNGDPEKNTVIGNRTNLLFVETCLNQIENTQKQLEH